MKKLQLKDFERIWRIFAVIAVLVFISIIWNGVILAEMRTVKLKDIMHHTRVPEPSTLLLFGSGIMGMIISFVRKTYAATKRFMDIAGSIVGGIVLLPFCFLISLYIKLVSKGPVIYKQIRIGLNGQLFEMYKFRTMKLDAEKDTGPVWAGKQDNRMIRGGHFLRKTHVDEIPQFINVLKGEMSIIGPRPERPFFVEKFKKEITDYEKRLLIKPGITGLAQVLHRYDETIRDVKIKIKYDLFYIKRMCLMTDLVIIYRTMRLILSKQ
jgi:lipopolysaccharide/colanic/teichoic acid biosynthesis glycosyltransferase